MRNNLLCLFTGRETDGQNDVKPSFAQERGGEAIRIVDRCDGHDVTVLGILHTRLDSRKCVLIVIIILRFGEFIHIVQKDERGRVFRRFSICFKETFDRRFVRMLFFGAIYGKRAGCQQVVCHDGFAYARFSL